MSPESFVYWLQGFAELTEDTPDETQWLMIRDHLREVFKKQTIDYQLNTPVWKQDMEFGYIKPKLIC
jgi:hypothetical protein